MSTGTPEPRIVQADGRAKVYRPLPVAERAVSVQAGFACYERGEAFEAHEAWEPAWMGTDDLAERALLQGLIKVAAAEVHAQRGNPAGVSRNLEGALERLQYARDAGVAVAPGAVVELPGLIDDVASRLATARGGDPGPAIAIAWSPRS